MDSPNTAPGQVFTKTQINRKSKSVIEGLTWTDNTRGISYKEQVFQTLKNLGAEKSKWFIGHRGVPDKNYRKQYYGRLIQFNCSLRQLTAVISPGRIFDPEKDIIDVRTDFGEGKTSGEITAIDVIPENFKIGDKIKITVVFSNTGSVVVKGAAITKVRTRDRSRETIREFWKNITCVKPGKDIRINHTLDTRGFKRGAYFVVGSVIFNGMNAIGAISINLKK